MKFLICGILCFYVLIESLFHKCGDAKDDKFLVVILVENMFMLSCLHANFQKKQVDQQLSG